MILSDSINLLGLGYDEEIETEESKFMDFSEALEYLKIGKRLRRMAWPENQYVVMQNGYPDGVPVNLQTAALHNVDEGDMIKFNPYFQIMNNDITISIWCPSSDDILANDWVL